MSKPKILITRRWPNAVEKALCETFQVTLNDNDEPLTPDAFQKAFSEYDAILPTVTDKLDEAAMAAESPKTKILANYGVGYSHINIERAQELGIVVTNTPDVLSDCTADVAMTLMLMAARRAGEGEREVRNKTWSGWCPTHMIGTKVTGKTLGIVGFGRIGQEMSRRAHFGFKMSIVVFNRSKVNAEKLAEFNAVQVDSLEELMPLCDFVSLHCPGGEENRDLINNKLLNLMKPDAFLINTARGEIVDEEALAQSLWFETIGGAALDVFNGEPKINPKLIGCENLTMLPHLGSATRETREAMGFRALANLNDFFEGREPRDRVV